MEPTTAADWMAVADERLADAEAILKERPESVASVYLAGYAIECSLKALLQKRGIASGSYGREGHDLRGLWSTAKLPFVGYSEAIATSDKILLDSQIWQEFDPVAKCLEGFL